MAGIYHNPELGVISMSSDGTNWLTIADKNLGATQVYNDGDTLSEANSGKFFQWGNNYGFSFTGSVTTSSSQVNAQNYGPGNYYSSSTFITRSSSPRGWDSSNNDNLWGGVTGTVEAMQGPCDNNYHIPNSYDINSLISIMQYFFGYGVSSGYITYLKIPMTGYRQGTVAGGNITNQGTYTRYWTSISYSEDSSTARALWIATESQNPLIGYSRNTKVEGFNIRPFANTPVIPDYTWTRLYGDEIPKPPKNYIKRFKNGGNYYYFGDAPVHTSGVTLNKSSLTLTEAGQTEQLVATVTPEDAVEKSVTWTSSDTTVAKVYQDGTVECITPGECTITCTVNDGGYTASCGVTNKIFFDYLLVGGGGGGGRGRLRSGGGGGGGGVLFGCLETGKGCSYPVTIGAGGISYFGYYYGICGSGCSSTFNGLTAYGGGGGGGMGSDVSSNSGANGGSGGGGSGCEGAGGGAGGSGCSGQGKNGGTGYGYCGGGGGGYCEAGCCGIPSGGQGRGGCGYYSDITGEGYWYASGGNGGGRPNGCCGGGGAGQAATTYGSGGGGGCQTAGSNCCSQGGNGCQGVFIISYLSGIGGITGGDCCYECNGKCIHIFTSDGTLCIN